MGKSQSKNLINPKFSSFETNVFINCPFDKDYYIPLLRPLLFTIIYLGFKPRIAAENFDSGELRFQKIIDLILNSKYSIHDLSRIKSKKKNELFRLNMSFELGIDIGCRLFNNADYKDKKCLILEKDPYRIKGALSDMAGSDIKSHNNEPEKLVLAVRNWFVENGLREAPNATKIWESFNDFMLDFYQKRKVEGCKNQDLEMMPIPEYIYFIEGWLFPKNS